MSIAKMTRRYLLAHPSVRECFSRGLVNYSALARVICDEYNLDQFEAVVAACRRFASSDRQISHEKRTTRLLASLRLHVTTRMAVAIVDQPRDLDAVHAVQKQARKARAEFNLIDGDRVLTIIFAEQYLPQVRVAFKNRFKKLSTSLVQLRFVFDEQIETTPGIVAHLYGLLAFNGINVLEEMSCWTDLMMILDQKDLTRALAVLEAPAEGALEGEEDPS
jgi:hypothetical protein